LDIECFLNVRPCVVIPDKFIASLDLIEPKARHSFLASFGDTEEEAMSLLLAKIKKVKLGMEKVLIEWDK
jgi:hypothetical protein